MADADTLNALRETAVRALMEYYRMAIRLEIEDPDHGAPEDAAELLAEKVVFDGYALLVTGDWHDLLD